MIFKPNNDPVYRALRGIHKGTQLAQNNSNYMGFDKRLQPYVRQKWYGNYVIYGSSHVQKTVIVMGIHIHVFWLCNEGGGGGILDEVKQGKEKKEECPI